MLKLLSDDGTCDEKISCEILGSRFENYYKKKTINRNIIKYYEKCGFDLDEIISYNDSKESFPYFQLCKMNTKLMTWILMEKFLS